LVIRTAPIALLRLGAYMLFWVAALIYLGATGGIAWLVGQAIPAVGVILFIVALGALAPIYKLAQRYVLYIIKAAQIAVISELLASGDLPTGMNQFEYGKERVQERFGEASAMFLVDELVGAVVKAFTNSVQRLASWLPGDTFRSLARVVGRIIHFALNYVDEAILARTFWLDRGSVWANARDGIVLYGMVWKPLLLNAVALMLLSYVPFVLALILFAAPVGALFSFVAPSVAGWSIIATLILAWLIKVALGDTFAMTAMIATYQQEIQGLEPDPAVSARIEQVSEKFGELKQRAEEEVDSMVGGTREESPAPVGE
jgi:hypothetical protein